MNRLVNGVVKQNAYMLTDSGIITACLNLNSIYNMWHFIWELNFDNNLLQYLNFGTGDIFEYGVCTTNSYFDIHVHTVFKTVVQVFICIGQ